MRINFSTAAVAVLLSASAPAAAQSVKSVVTASNGVSVTVYSDEFAARYEYSAPSVDVKDGFVLVATVKRGGVLAPIHLSGGFVYSGEWRRYSSALFRGGAPAKFIDTGKKVGSCASSRYSRPSCTLSEAFRIEITPAEIKQHAVNGVLAIQVRAADTSSAIIEIPISYIEAVDEISKR